MSVDFEVLAGFGDQKRPRLDQVVHAGELQLEDACRIHFHVVAAVGCYFYGFDHPPESYRTEVNVGQRHRLPISAQNGAADAGDDGCGLLLLFVHRFLRPHRRDEKKHRDDQPESFH